MPFSVGGFIMSTDKKYIEPELDEDATPLCLRCLAPVAQFAKVCPHCGSSIGMHVPYASYGKTHETTEIPKQTWERLWQRDTPIFRRLLYLMILVMCLPSALLSLILMVWSKLRGRAK